MICLFLLAIASWIAVLAYMAPAVWALYVSQGRHGDPARLQVALTALLLIGFLSRRVWAGETDLDWPLIGLLLAVVVHAVFTLWVARTYGRGKRV